MAHPLVFVIAPAEVLPGGETSWDTLLAAQRQGPASAFALRLFTASGTAADQLSALPWDGSLDAMGGSQQRRLICDAVIPLFDPQGNAMGVYQRGSDPNNLTCLDRFPLLEASNETCWFYPTHDGTFLSWKRTLALALEPGVVAKEAEEKVPGSYERSHVTLLWSLLADDESLTCVGLTYGGQRIEWRQSGPQPESNAIWGLFTVDTQAEVSLTVDACETVVQQAT